MHNVQQSHLVPHVLQKTACVVWPLLSCSVHGNTAAQFAETLVWAQLGTACCLLEAQNFNF